MSRAELAENVPSEQIDLLNQLKKYKVLKLIRYSWLAPDESSQEWNLNPSSVFRLTSGPLLMVLETGLVLGFSSLPEKSSVTLWIERTEQGEQNKKISILNDDELFPIDSCDPIYSEKLLCNIVDQSAVSITILKKVPENSLLKELPCEVGLVIEFQNSVKLILSHGIHDNSDDFAIVFEREISKGIFQKLKKIAI